jgi:hypothetical protein
MEKLGTPCLWIGSTGFRRLFIFVNKVLPIASRRVNSSSAAYWQKKTQLSSVRTVSGRDLKRRMKNKAGVPRVAAFGLS